MSDTTPAKPLRKKTDRRMVVWVAVIGMVLLVVYLFASQGSDLGQSKVTEKKKEKDAADLAVRYQAKIADPQAATQANMAAAQQQAQKKREESAQAAVAALPAQAPIANRVAPSQISPPEDGFPPPAVGDSDEQYRRLAKGAREVNSTSDRHSSDGSNSQGANGSAAAPRPSFVMYQAPEPKDKFENLHDALKVDSASGSPTPVNSQAPISQSDIDNATDPQMKAAYQRLAEAQKRQASLDKLVTGSAEQVDKPNGESNTDWLYRARNEKVQLSKSTVAQRTDALYWLAPGTIVHGIILNAIDTRLPGSVTIRVTEAVYDSRYGRYMVIPAGSTLLGSYNDNVSDGQHRAMLAITTLVTPSGGMVDLGSLPGADYIGTSGVEGKLHTHFAQRMGIATLFAIEAVGMDRLNRPQTVVSPYGSGASDQQGITSGAQIITAAANDEIKRRSNVGPNITVKPGALMSITLQTGIEIPPIANAR